MQVLEVRMESQTEYLQIEKSLSSLGTKFRIRLKSSTVDNWSRIKSKHWNKNDISSVPQRW